jgi:hypothetical protein
MHFYPVKLCFITESRHKSTQVDAKSTLADLKQHIYKTTKTYDENKSRQKSTQVDAKSTRMQMKTDTSRRYVDLSRR